MLDATYSSRQRDLERTSVRMRTDGIIQKAQARCMRAGASPLEQNAMVRTAPNGCLLAPIEVFYVVQTSAGIVGERHHRVQTPLYETRLQAKTELMRLQAAGSSDNVSYSVWNAATYVEPAGWRYDVAMADGTVIHPRGLPSAGLAWSY